MPKRKYPFEDCCNYIRQLKMHVAQASFSNDVRGETWSSFNDSSCSHSATAVNATPSSDTVPFVQGGGGGTKNKKIQLFVTPNGQLCRTTPPSLPTSSSVPTQMRCHSCCRPADAPPQSTTSHHCHFCEKLVCDACIQFCVNCKEEFCVLCSVKIYHSKEDVTLCLSCS